MSARRAGRIWCGWCSTGFHERCRGLLQEAVEYLEKSSGRLRSKPEVICACSDRGHPVPKETR